LEQQERPPQSGWRYLLGALFAGAGIAVFVVFQISSTNPDLRMVLPGAQQLDLDAGDYTLFYEHTTILDGIVFATDSVVPGILFYVIGPDDNGVELKMPSSNRNYELDGRAGYSVVNFKIDDSGTYTVGGRYAEGQTDAVFVFAVGKSTSGSFLVAILSLLSGLGISLALLVSTFMKRKAGYGY